MKRSDGIDDFEATVRIMREDEGGRRSPTFNGIRWDFCYAEDDPKDGIWMVYPDFHDAAGESLAEDQPLPVDSPLPARMFVLIDEMREEVHRKKVQVGGRFYCHEGSRRVAEGTITRITGLFHERKKKKGQQGARANATTRQGFRKISSLRRCSARGSA